jgi:hypothetical protein
MKNFIADVKALFRQKYDADAQGNKANKPAFIDLPPDIKPDNRHRVSQSSQNDDTDDFASFIISSGKSNNVSGVSANKQLGRWFKENESFDIKGRFIDRGFYYVGGQFTMLTGFGIEPSLVDDSLPASSPNIIHSISQIYYDESLGYWPSY